MGSEEQIQPVEITAGSYNHILQSDPKILEHEIFGPILKKPESGICWAASTAMAVASLTGQDSYTVLSKIGKLVYETVPQDFATIQEEMREKYGNELAVPFIQHSRMGMVSPSGGLEPFFLQNYPAQTAKLFEYLIGKYITGTESIEVKIPPRLSLQHESYDLLKELATYSSKRVAVLRVVNSHVTIDSYRTANHMVFIGGVVLGSNVPVTARLSDPNALEPVWLTRPEFDDLIQGTGLTFRRTIGGSSSMRRQDNTPIIWFEKKKD